MKRLLSVFICLVLVLSFGLVGCGGTEAETLKFGFATFSAVDESTSADGDTNGAGSAAITVAAVLVDKDGKIVKCVIDTAEVKGEYTADGKAVAAGEFKTKREKGDAYGMKAYAGSAKEWYEQADAFAAQCVGKKESEIASLVVNGKGNDDVVAAGCTIYASEFAAAVEEAVKNTTDSAATADATLNIGVVSTQAEAKDASADAAGTNEIDTTIAVAVVKDGKVLAMASDAIQTTFKFDQKGKADAEAVAPKSKLEAGANYGMSQYGQDLNGDGKVLEWFEQAAAFNTACEGKTASEISALAVDTGYGVESLQTAGCTINVADMVKAAVKAATVA